MLFSSRALSEALKTLLVVSLSTETTNNPRFAKESWAKEKQAAQTSQKMTRQNVEQGKPKST